MDESSGEPSLVGWFDASFDELDELDGVGDTRPATLTKVRSASLPTSNRRIISSKRWELFKICYAKNNSLLFYYYYFYYFIIITLRHTVIRHWFRPVSREPGHWVSQYVVAIRSYVGTVL